MKIKIEAVCRKCGIGDVQPRITVSDWDAVKIKLQPTEKWKCPKCGCSSAYWYFERDLSELTESERWKLVKSGTVFKQLFAHTEDAKENLYEPQDLAISLFNPETSTSETGKIGL